MHIWAVGTCRGRGEAWLCPHWWRSIVTGAEAGWAGWAGCDLLRIAGKVGFLNLRESCWCIGAVQLTQPGYLPHHCRWFTASNHPIVVIVIDTINGSIQHPLNSTFWGELCDKAAQGHFPPVCPHLLVARAHYIFGAGPTQLLFHLPRQLVTGAGVSAGEVRRHAGQWDLCLDTATLTGRGGAGRGGWPLWHCAGPRAGHQHPATYPRYPRPDTRAMRCFLMLRVALLVLLMPRVSWSGCKE